MLFTFNSLEADASCRCSLNFAIFFHEALEGSNDNFRYGDVIPHELKVAASYYPGDGSASRQRPHYQKNSPAQ